MQRLHTFLFATSLALASALPAQLAGAYVVGPGGNFANLAAAFAALTQNGVSGPTSFLVTANDSGPWTLGAFAGQGPGNPVLFDGQGTITLAGAQPMLTLAGCANVTFRGFVGTFASATNAFVVNAGTSDCTFVGCDFRAPTATTGVALFNLVGGSGTRIEDCWFGGAYEALYAQLASDRTEVRNCRILGGGFWIMRCAGSNIVVADNFISGPSNYGISCGVSGTPSSGANLKIWHNSIYITHPTTGSQYCSLRWYSNSTTTEVLDNILYDSYATGSALNMWCSGALRPAWMDFNCLWSNVAAYTPIYASANQTLATWQALGFDLSSIQADPMFAGPALTPPDLSLQTGSPCEFVGTPLATVVTDFFQAMRTPPVSIGAHEAAGGIGASYRVFDAGCAGPAGIPSNTAWTTPVLGNTATITVGNLPAPWLAAMVMGWSYTNSPFGPLPLHLAPLGAPGCSALVRPDLTTFLVGSGGSATTAMTVPVLPILVGLQFYTQAYAIDAAANALGLVPSDAAIATIGL